MTELTDRELDAWLAEHLFGWRNPTVDQHGEYPADYVVDDDGNAVWLSSTGDGMLLVMLAMRGRGWGAFIVPLPLVGGWGVEFEYAGTTTQGVDWGASHASPPRAVAEAAKAALEA